ncbi:MAG: hypothetical protein JWN79_1842 [Gemmatimonadetes bacterium]|nr:hypothetical protein [Gemmatimonadota bacterium]
MTARRVVIGALAATAVLLLLGRWSAALYTDFLWFQSMGAAAVWRARLATTAAIETGSFLVAAAFAFANVYAVRRSVVSLVLPRRIANLEIGEEVSAQYLLYAVLALSASVGIAMLLPTDGWSDALLAATGRPFGEADPYLGTDLGFFVYWLPFETTLHYWAVLLFVLVTGIVILLYALTPSLRWERSRLYVSPYVQRHLIVLGGVLLLVLAWSYRLGTYELLSAGSGAEGAFTMLDQLVLLPVMLLLAVISLCAAIVVIWSGWTGQTRLAFVAVGAVLLLSGVGRGLAPPLVRRMMDPADAAVQERAYTGTRLGYTRRAFGVDRIQPETLATGFATLSQAGPRVAVWDGATLAHAAQRLRRVRVVGTGAAWQQADSGIAAALVERSSEGLGSSRDVWGVRRLDPTTADERGMPARELRQRVDEMVLAEPAVYDSAPEYSVLADSLSRIVGVEMVSTGSRLAHAWSLQNFRLLFGELPADRPTIVRHRDVRDRLHELAPFFVQGGEVLPLVAHDSLYWIVELYAASSSYPLARHFTLLGEERSYLQHAATAVVHAASGRVRLLADPSPDALTLSWITRFPSLFVLPGALSPVLLQLLPPVTDGAHAQMLAFAAAGFRRDSFEVRHLAVPDGADSAASREPVHALLPGLGVSVLWPLLDQQERVRGVVAAVGGSARGTSWIPLESDGQVWGRVVDRLRGSEPAAQERALVRGPVRVLPVGGQAFYLQSAFQWRPDGSPALRYVATLAGDSVRTGRTLAATLPVGSADAAPVITAGDARQRAESLYREMRGALSRGDWAAFGRAFDSLGAALRMGRDELARRPGGV